MKRFVYLFVVLALLLSVSVPALATSEPESAVQQATEQAYLSEDLMTLEYNKQTYVRFNDTYLEGNYKSSDIQLVLPEAQKSVLSSRDVMFLEGYIALLVQLEYQDGVSMQISFIRQDLQETYQKLLETDKVIVEFRYPTDNNVEITLDYDTMEEDVFFDDDMNIRSSFPAVVSDENMTVNRGHLLLKDDQYYYFDFQQNNSTNYYMSRAKVWRITDEATCAKLDAATERYYGEGVGFLEDEEFTTDIFGVLLVIMFAILPVVVLAVFLVLAIRAKKPVYKKLCWNLCAWSAVLLVGVGMIIAIIQQGS